MKRSLLVVAMMLMLWTALLAQMTLPRVYVQKLLLEGGENPVVTNIEGKSALEYKVEAWISEMEGCYMSSDTHPPNSIVIKLVGDGEKFPVSVILTVQLGNFQKQWEAGQTLNISVTHKQSKQNYSWSLAIPEGTNVIRHLDDPVYIPPFPKKDDKARE